MAMFVAAITRSASMSRSFSFSASSEITHFVTSIRPLTVTTTMPAPAFPSSGDLPELLLHLGHGRLQLGQVLHQPHHLPEFLSNMPPLRGAPYF